MKYLKLAPWLAVVAGLMAFTAVPAMAAEAVWVGCKENAGHGQWKNNQCSEVENKGNFETKEQTETSEVTSATTGSGLELSDSKATGGETAVTCVGGGRGWSGANGLGGVTVARVANCKFVKAGACEASKPVIATARNLPWATTLQDASGHVRLSLLPTVQGKEIGKGEPGYSVECTVGGVLKVTDTCEGKTTTAVRNSTSRANNGEGTVEAEFEGKSETSTCSIGGAEAGRIAGITLFRLGGIPRVLWWSQLRI
jgi:hypothetical protein